MRKGTSRSAAVLLIAVFLCIVSSAFFPDVQLNAQEQNPERKPPQEKQEKTYPGFKDIKEKTGVYVFIAWLWLSVLVLVFFLRLKIKEADRLHEVGFYWSSSIKKH